MQPGDEAQVCTSISQKLAGLTTEKSKSFIYRLHSHLRNVNDKAYEPEILAIGPYHRDKDNVKMVEEHKLRYLRSLLERKNENIAVYVSAIGEMEQEARKCYTEPFSLNAAEFTEMLVLDGCFINELVRKFNMDQLSEKYDPIFEMSWMTNSLLRDLMLFENQIPFFILCKLFDLIEIPNNHGRFMYLALNIFQHVVPGTGCGLSIGRSSNEIKHLLDLIHISWCPPLTSLDIYNNTIKDRQRTWRFINSVTELRNANVKFKRSERGSLFDIRFEKGYLLLPSLTIEDHTESIFRNLIAYEMYFVATGGFTYVADYVKFLDCLINSSADVEILCRHGIIDNWLGDGEVVSNMFVKLGDSVPGSGYHFIYSKIFDSVNAHCERRRNRWMAKLKQHHLSSPWAMISILAAIVLLLLTATQTVFSVLK